MSSSRASTVCEPCLQSNLFVIEKTASLFSQKYVEAQTPRCVEVVCNVLKLQAPESNMVLLHCLGYQVSSVIMVNITD